LRRREARLRALGIVLALAATFVMVSGDLPRPDAGALTRVTLVRIMTSPWFYLALFGLGFATLGAVDARRLLRMAAGALRSSPFAVLGTGLLIPVLFSQLPSLSWFALGCLAGVGAFAIFMAHALCDEAVCARMSVVIVAAALVLAVRTLVFRADEGLGVGAYHVTNNAWLGKLQIAWVLNFVAPFALARLIETRRTLASAFYGGTWLAIAACIHFLYSRTGSLALALTTLAMCALNLRSWRRWATLLVIAAVLVLAVAAHTGGMSIYVTAARAVARDSGIVMRHSVWREALAIITDHPVSGIGLGTYDDIAYSRYRSSGGPEFFRNGWHAHNLFLHVLAETGIVGLAAWSYFWFAIVRFLLRRWRDGDEGDRLHSGAALCLVFGFVVLSLTEVLIAARVHASLRMHLTLAVLLVYGCRLASRTGISSSRTTSPMQHSHE
jgi:O-antigen ligase/polysaccharide polymerase Wzy-like membrane protein